jgi:hypothetical protein
MEAGHTPCAHVALGLYLSAGHIPAHTCALGFLRPCWAHPAHTWHLGCGGLAPLGTSGGWVMAPDSREMNRASGPMINGSSIRTQFYWVLYQDSMFMRPRILNIIICFRNIISFIIINIINKIINKFEIKNYYLYYKLLWFFYKNKKGDRSVVLLKIFNNSKY